MKPAGERLLCKFDTLRKGWALLVGIIKGFCGLVKRHYGLLLTIA
jgi:hypothetical protein